MNKTLIALSAAALFGSLSAAQAYEAPENKIGDRYPFLEQTYAPIKSTWVGGTVMPRQLVQYGNEAPENMTGDRYPALATVYQPIAVKVVGRAYRQVVNSGTYGNEAPENKISDRYPLLELQVASQSGPARRFGSRMNSTTIR